MLYPTVMMIPRKYSSAPGDTPVSNDGLVHLHPRLAHVRVAHCCKQGHEGASSMKKSNEGDSCDCRIVGLVVPDVQESFVRSFREVVIVVAQRIDGRDTDHDHSQVVEGVSLTAGWRSPGTPPFSPLKISE